MCLGKLYQFTEQTRPHLKLGTNRHNRNDYLTPAILNFTYISTHHCSKVFLFDDSLRGQGWLADGTMQMKIFHKLHVNISWWVSQSNASIFILIHKFQYFVQSWSFVHQLAFCRQISSPNSSPVVKDCNSEMSKAEWGELFKNIICTYKSSFNHATPSEYGEIEALVKIILFEKHALNKIMISSF